MISDWSDLRNHRKSKCTYIDFIIFASLIYTIELVKGIESKMIRMKRWHDITKAPIFSNAQIL